MKDIPGTVTERVTMLLPDYFDIGEILSSSLSGVEANKMQIEKRQVNNEMIGAKYEVAILIEGEELELALNHYNFLRKYNLA